MLASFLKSDLHHKSGDESRDEHTRPDQFGPH